VRHASARVAEGGAFSISFASAWIFATALLKPSASISAATPAIA
jgi:hypothetical protein